MMDGICANPVIDISPAQDEAFDASLLRAALGGTQGFGGEVEWARAPFALVAARLGKFSSRLRITTTQVREAEASQATMLAYLQRLLCNWFGCSQDIWSCDLPLPVPGETPSSRSHQLIFHWKPAASKEEHVQFVRVAAQKQLARRAKRAKEYGAELLEVVKTLERKVAE